MRCAKSDVISLRPCLVDKYSHFTDGYTEIHYLVYGYSPSTQIMFISSHLFVFKKLYMAEIVHGRLCMCVHAQTPFTGPYLGGWLV